MSTIEELPIHLQGNGAPLPEERAISDLKVIGEIPAELDGRYLRNGPNPLSGFTEHPFIGDGMIHGIRLREGRVEWYRNRYVMTPFIATPDDTDIDPTDMAASKANTNVIGHGGKFLALEEGHFPYVLDGNLDTVGPTDFGKKLTGAFTAHPKVCPATGELLGFGYSLFAPHLRYLRVSAAGELVQAEDITVGGPTMMHDFNITENYVIFMDLPAVFDLEMLMTGEMPIRWGEDYPARLGVMPRNGDDSSVIWYDIDPCYVFHPMNAYEQDDNIIIDVARMDHVWRENALDFPDPSLHRWTIDTRSGRVAQDQVDDLPAEFPRVPADRVGRKHRYGYMMGNATSSTYTAPLSCSGALLKYDFDTGTRSSIDVGRGRIPGESSFVPRADALNEDDGYLMTYVHDANTEVSEFVIFDAASMSDEPVARVELPRVPFGFHGNWVPSSVAD